MLQRLRQQRWIGGDGEIVGLGAADAASAGTSYFLVEHSRSSSLYWLPTYNNNVISDHF